MSYAPRPCRNHTVGRWTVHPDWFAGLGLLADRNALTNNRLVSLSETEVRFRYKDYAHGNRRKVMALEPQEFIRRYLTHVLPKGFMRIRHYGLNGNRTKRHQLAQARTALDCTSSQPAASPPETIEAFWLRVAHLDIHQCPH
ncbi:MAG: transposase, partial [Burkholderiales bacterium]